MEKVVATMAELKVGGDAVASATTTTTTATTATTTTATATTATAASTAGEDEARKKRQGIVRVDQM